MDLAIDPAALPEGRPATLTARVGNPDGPGLLLAYASLACGPARARVPLSRRVEGPSGDPYAEDAVEVYLLLAPGGAKELPLEVVPLAGRDREVRVELAAIALDRLEPGEPKAHGEGEMALPASLADLVPPASVALSATLTVTPAPFPSSEAFSRAGLSPGDIDLAVYLEGPALRVLETGARADRFGRPVRGHESRLVPREGEARRHGGSLGRLALELCRRAEVPLGVSRAGDDAERRAGLVEALSARGLLAGPDPARAEVRATAARLVELAEVLSAKGFAVSSPSRSVFRVDADPWAARAPAASSEGEGRARPGVEAGPDLAREPLAMREQGCLIPCVECRVLRPGRKDCPECGGAGERFQPAQMADRELQREFGARSRKQSDAALARARAATGDRVRGAWETARGLLRGALLESVIYGPAWAAGWEGLEGAPEDLDAAEVLAKAVQERIRDAVLDAEARAAGK